MPHVSYWSTLRTALVFTIAGSLRGHSCELFEAAELFP